MKIHRSLLTMLFCFLTSVSAHAALITEWGFVNSAGFTQWVGAGVTPSGGSLYNGVDTWYSDLAWGNPAPPNTEQSSFSVISPVGGSIFTNGASANGTTLIHNNFPVFDNGVLQSAQLLDMLMLTPLDPPGPALEAPTIIFDINYFETPNGSNPCPNGDPNGVGANINGCGDIFAIASPLNLMQSFIMDDYEYTINIGIVGGGILADTTCVAVGFGAGCYGFVTTENLSNTIQPFFAITATQVPRVPEPSTLALFGVVLLLIRKAVKQ
jgi:hypothetical protein